MVDNKSYVHIWGWMINELGLKWNELLVYAVINSFTNNTKDHYFNWSLSYLSERTHQTTRNVQRCLKSLLDKWLITKDEKYDNWIKFVRYQAEYRQNVQGIDKMSIGYRQNVQGGIDKMSNNIQVYNTKEIQEKENKESESELDIALNDLIEARKKIRKPMTERAIKLVKNKLEKMYPWDTEMQIISINQSIERGWQSVFEVKEQDLKYYKQQPKKKRTIELILHN